MASTTRASILFVAFAHAAGLASAQVWDQRNQLLQPDGDMQHGMDFGDSFAVGDFNGDGADDLAVGAWRFENGNLADAGRVDVYLNTGSGLSSIHSFRRNGYQADQYLGWSLAAGDFDDNGRDELVIGAYGTDVGSPAVLDAGSVEVWRMNPQGSWTQANVLHQDSPGVPGVAEEEDQFGVSVAVGNFNGDAFDDLAIGVPWEMVGAVDYAGAVNVLYGSATGLKSDGAQLFYRGGGGLNGELDFGQYLGTALAAGDFDSDGDDELAIGVPGDLLSSGEAADGSVVVLDGQAGQGLLTAGQQWIDREILGRFDAGSDTKFGTTLAAGDLDSSPGCEVFGTCADDLVVGAPLGAIFGLGGGGAVYVLFGSVASGLVVATNVAINQAVYDPVAGTPPEENDRFGSAIAVGSLRGGGRADLAVGSLEEDLEGILRTGCVHVARSVGPGFDATSNPEAQYIYARTGLGAAPALSQEFFGSALAIGDFDADGWGDLAVGVTGYSPGQGGRSGAVQILYGGLYNDGFESTTLSTWSNY